MTGQKHARHVGPARRRNGLMLLVAGIAVVALLVGWSVNQVLSHTVEPEPSPATGGSSSADAAGGASPSPPAASTDQQAGSGSSRRSPAERCARDVAEVETAVDAARPGVDHWSTHVQARTDMLAGRISTKRMDAVYARTKSLGHGDQRRFAAAVARIGRRTPCHELRTAAAPPTDKRAKDCLARARSATAALGAARSTMGEWQSHLRHMEQYSDGGMRSGKALALWITAWRKAPKGISAFHDAIGELATAPSCAAR